MVDVVSVNISFLFWGRLVHDSQRTLKEEKERFKHYWVIQRTGQMLCEHVRTIYCVFTYLINLSYVSSSDNTC